MFVVYSNGQFVSLEKGGEKRLGRKDDDKDGKRGKKTQEGGKMGRQSRRQKDHICIRALLCPSRSQHPAKSYILSPNMELEPILNTHCIYGNRLYVPFLL